MTWAIITTVLLLWIFGFSSEARAKRARKKKARTGPSAYSTYINKYWDFKIRLHKKRNADIILYLNKWYFPDSFVCGLVLEDVCGYMPYKDNEVLVSHYIDYLKEDPRDNRILKSIELSFDKERCPEVIRILEPLSRRDRKRFVLSLIRDAMKNPSYSSGSSYA